MSSKSCTNKKWSFRTWWKGFNKDLIPLIIIAAFLPFYCQLTVSQSQYPNYYWCPDGDPVYTDLYLNCKKILFTIIGIFMIVRCFFLIIKLKREDRINLLKRLIPLAVYSGFVLLSFFFAINKTAAIKGEFEQQEPLFVLLSYAMTVLYSLLVIKDKNDIRKIFVAFSAGVFLVALMGVCEIKYGSWLNQKWYQILITLWESKYRNGISTDDPMLCSSLFNSNYLGFYAVFMFFMVATLLFCKNRWWQKILLILIEAGDMVMLLKSESKTGLIIFAFVFFVIIVFCLKPILRKWFIFVPLLVIAFFSVYRFDKITEGKYSQKVVAALKTEKVEYNLTELDTSNPWAEFHYKGKILKIYFDIENDQFVFSCLEDEVPCTVNYDLNKVGGRTVVLSDGEEIPVEFIYDEKYGFCFVVTLENRKYTFTNQLNSTKDMKIINENGKIAESVISENIFAGKERMASNRGYSWGLTIPLLKKYIFWGAGPDNFPFAFYDDATDYAIIFNVFYDNYIRWGNNTMYTRPHNLYLQMGINTGVISLLAFLTFVGGYLVDCCRLYFWKTPDGDTFRMGFGCMISAIAFLGMAITNDSMVVVTPLFYLILGLGMCINRIRFEEREKALELSPKQEIAEQKAQEQKAQEQKAAEHKPTEPKKTQKVKSSAKGNKINKK